jgi:hypothetical protein
VTQMNTGFPTLEVCEYCNQAFAEGVVEEHCCFPDNSCVTEWSNGEVHLTRSPEEGPIFTQIEERDDLVLL